MLKRFSRSVTIFLLFCVLFLFSENPLNVSAKNLDEIWDYTIEVTPYTDGSLDMTYHITWEVLDSTSEGPLEWVKIGIPNRHIEDIEALSDNIENIKYYNDNGDYIRIDFDRSYYAGEVVSFDFSFHQHQMYEKENGFRVYTFTPGWFPKIEVDSLTIRWNANKVSSVSPGSYKENGFYQWDSSLSEGEKYTITVIYPEEVFSSEDTTRTAFTIGQRLLILLLLVLFPAVFCILLCILRCCNRLGKKDYYNKHSGMGSVYAPTSRSSTRHGGHGGCACACACACAGGGRAGCSTKDFYGTKLYTKKIKRALEK